MKSFYSKSSEEIFEKLRTNTSFDLYDFFTSLFRFSVILIIYRTDRYIFALQKLVNFLKVLEVRNDFNINFRVLVGIIFIYLFISIMFFHSYIMAKRVRVHHGFTAVNL